MIKLRLWGEPSELAELTKHIESDERVSVLSVSDQYQDRGKSSYVRVYIDIKLKAATEKQSEKMVYVMEFPEYDFCLACYAEAIDLAQDKMLEMLEKLDPKSKLIPEGADFDIYSVKPADKY